MINETAVGRVVQFEFVGGPHDGLVVRGPLCGPDYDEGDGLLWRTDGGRPGTEFWMPTEYATSVIKAVGPEGLELLSESGYRFPGHRYEVLVRRWDKGVLIIRSQHLGHGE